MKITETKTFRAIIAPKVAEIAEFTAQCEQLARTIEDKNATNVGLSKSKRRPVKGDEKKLCSLQRRITALQEHIIAMGSAISSFTWPQALGIMVECKGNVWNDRQLELGKKETEAYEGKYEDSYRDVVGWALGAASLNTSDFPDGGEGKYIGNGDSTFRVSRAGTRAFGRLLKGIIRELPDDVMSEEQWDIMWSGEVSAGKIYHSFPEVVRARIQKELAPERVLSCPYVVFFTDVGYFRVSRDEYATALGLASVTQMSPKYRVKREYVEGCIMQLSPVQQQADVAAE